MDAVSRYASFLLVACDLLFGFHVIHGLMLIFRLSVCGPQYAYIRAVSI
jgi:hypothetical protein